MRNFWLTVALLGVGWALSAQVIDKPAIKIEYESVDIITEKVLEHRFEQQKNMARIYQQDPNLIHKKEVAQSLVQEALLLQSAKSNKITVDDYAIDSQIRQHKELIGQQLGRKLTDDEYDRFLSRYGLTLTDLKENFRRASTIQQLVNKEKADTIKNFKQPTEADAVKYFNLQKESGRIHKPTYVAISHIFFNTQGKRYEEMKAVHTQAQSVLAKLKKGASFEDCVTQYSEDAETVHSKGKLGWTSVQDPRFLQLFGEDACLEIVSLAKGAYSSVVESPAGFHIIKVTDKEAGGIPAITDKINPQINQTWKEYIFQLLLKESAERAFMEAMQQLASEIQQDAIITYYNKELQ